MAKPSEAATWATDATQTAGTQIGQDTKLKPSAGQIAQGNQAGVSAPAKWYNWLFNLLGQWTQYLNNLENESAFLGANFNWTATHNFRGATFRIDNAAAEPVYGNGSGVTTARSREINVSAFDLIPHGFAANPNSVPGSGYVYIDENRGTGKPYYSVEISRFIPGGATITGVRALVKPGAARAVKTTASGDNGRMWIGLLSYAPNYSSSPGSPSYVATEEDDGTTNAQAISLGTLSFGLVRSSTTLQLLIWGGDDAGTNLDRVYGVEVTFTDYYARAWF